jgi:hypothetical protein
VTGSHDDSPLKNLRSPRQRTKRFRRRGLLLCLGDGLRPGADDGGDARKNKKTYITVRFDLFHGWPDYGKPDYFAAAKAFMSWAFFLEAAFLWMSFLVAA